jgi:hypothetical protein
MGFVALRAKERIISGPDLFRSFPASKLPILHGSDFVSAPHSFLYGAQQHPTLHSQPTPVFKIGQRGALELREANPILLSY